MIGMISAAVSFGYLVCDMIFHTLSKDVSMWVIITTSIGAGISALSISTMKRKD